MHKIVALLGLVALLAGCANTPVEQHAQAEPWNGGTWNSMLGYHGPANAMVTGGPSR